MKVLDLASKAETAILIGFCTEILKETLGAHTMTLFAAVYFTHGNKLCGLLDCYVTTKLR